MKASFVKSQSDIGALRPLNNKEADLDVGDEEGETSSLLTPQRHHQQQRQQSNHQRPQHEINDTNTKQHPVIAYIKKSPLLSKDIRGLSLSFRASKNRSLLPLYGHQAHHHVLLLRENHVSLEHLSPHHECLTRKSSMKVAIVNLVATVCGGGVLSLPLAFCRAGIIPTTLILLYAAITTEFALICLIDSARKTGGRSYGDVAQAAFGSAAQVITTFTLGLHLLGTLTAYMVLVKDVWTQLLMSLCHPALKQWLVFHLSRGAATGPAADDDYDSAISNYILAAILVISSPLLVKKDLHALRHTCYVGSTSCFLLMLAIVYRAFQTIQRSNHHPSTTTLEIRWYSTDPADLLFAFPIAALCFFCSFNVLSIHSHLVNPTRERIQSVVSSSMIVCFAMFYLVGAGGYIYAGNYGTPDNILVAFPVTDHYVMVGRIGYCFTLVFAMPLALLPCREALAGLPAQIMAWKRDDDLIRKYRQVAKTRKTGAHLIINGVDFDESEPALVSTDPKQRHGAMLYGSCDANHTLGAATAASIETTASSGGSTTGTTETACSTSEELSSSTLSGAPVVDMTAARENINDEYVDEVGELHHRYHEHGENHPHGGGGVVDLDAAKEWKQVLSHYAYTAAILALTYTAAVLVPGVAAVWSICGSSMAVWIGFITPTACFLKIRGHKGLTFRACGAWILLLISLVAMVVCTKEAVKNAFAEDSMSGNGDE